MRTFRIPTIDYKKTVCYLRSRPMHVTFQNKPGRMQPGTIDVRVQIAILSNP